MNADTSQPQSQLFTKTHWSVVLAAGRATTPEAAAALDRLCHTYWRPLYLFVRRRGYGVHDAQDLTQEFFSRLLTRGDLSTVDPLKGRFRSFLLAALDHFLANDWRRATAQKRGGGAKLISLDHDAAEQEYLQIASASLSPEKVFDQQWAVVLLDHTVSRLREEFAGAGKSALFDELKVFLTGEKPKGGYAELALKLNTTEAALKMTVSRMRQRYGEILRAEIANTVSSPDEIEEEMHALFAALS
jgi:RNA polymerase sigma-70 factor (ECF subfamily)